ncbi:MAG: helix-hairpin-helix domain-containing protein [Ignavibacteriales bacterium]|nr:helix-hairpin-helix domain-containing protein [Ignavibacteriales bacterium]
MNEEMKRLALKQLQEIPGVGKSIAQDLWELGIHRMADLKGRDPEKLYEKRCTQVGTRIDPCLLYVFRGAVYYASHTRHAPELLKWWNWKDRSSTRR